jgi:tumor protein p53-inducible protein 3
MLVSSPLLHKKSSKGYAEYCAAPAITCMKVPESLPTVQAAGVPEAFLTAFQLLHTVGHVQVYML